MDTLIIETVHSNGGFSWFNVWHWCNADNAEQIATAIEARGSSVEIIHNASDDNWICDEDNDVMWDFEARH